MLISANTRMSFLGNYLLILLLHSNIAHASLLLWSVIIPVKTLMFMVNVDFNTFLETEVQAFVDMIPMYRLAV